MPTAVHGGRTARFRKRVPQEWCQQDSVLGAWGGREEVVGAGPLHKPAALLSRKFQLARCSGADVRTGALPFFLFVVLFFFSFQAYSVGDTPGGAIKTSSGVC
jgi:hypothetical protein